MAELKWNDWERSVDCQKQMDDVEVHGFKYTKLFHRAMRLLFLDDHEKASPARVVTGAILARAAEVKTMNGNKMYGCSWHEVERSLANDSFPYNVSYDHRSGGGGFVGKIFDTGMRSTGTTPKLTFDSYPIHRLTQHPPELAYTKHDDYVVRFNWDDQISWVRQSSNDHLKERLEWLAAGVILHQIMHHLGFDHPNENEENYDRRYGGDYTSSLPVMAELAVYKQSPYFEYFEAFTVATHERPASRLPKCGTVRRR